MNVCFVNATRKWGGVKTWTLDVAEGLKGRGHRVRLFARTGPFADRARKIGLEVRTLGFGCDYHPVTILRFLLAFRRDRPQVVVCNVGKDLRTAGIAARLLGIPVVQRVGLPGDMRDTLDVRLVHRLIRPRILVPCRFIADGLSRRLPHLDPADMTVILTGKVPAEAPPVRVHAPLRFISTSQIAPDKGHAVVMEALAALKDRFAFEYHVVGTGRSEAGLRRQAKALGIEDRMVWKGFHDHVGPLLRQADVFLLPSRKEGLPNALLEAMALGLVPVARDVGGVREVWPVELEPLLLPRAADAPAFAEVLARVMEAGEPRLLSWMRASWTACRRTFALENTVSRLESWLASVAD